MKNEPVAWMDKETGCFVYSQYDYEDLDEHGKDGLIPLYTHPSDRIAELEQQLKEEIQARADALDDLNNRMMNLMKSYNEMAWKLEEVGGAYTHPVKEPTEDTECQYCKQGCIRCDARKLLTDEEITEIFDTTFEVRDFEDSFIKFARAILRKAQEK
jgi:hypothetical protein